MISLKKQRGGCILRDADKTYIITSLVRADNGTPFMGAAVPVVYLTKALYARKAAACARAQQLRDDVKFVVNHTSVHEMSPERVAAVYQLIAEA